MVVMAVVNCRLGSTIFVMDGSVWLR